MFSLGVKMGEWFRPFFIVRMVMGGIARAAANCHNMDEQDDRKAWLQLVMVPGLGSASIGWLVSELGTPRAVLAEPAKAEAVLRAHGFAAGRALDARRALVELAASEPDIKGDFLIMTDPEYPALLRETFVPPRVVFLRGRRDALQGPAVALVGTRHPTAYGTRVTRDLARDLASAGVLVVSGLARGIDAEAHRGALDAGGKTVAVLGCGVDRCYPPEHSVLCTEIAFAGAVISEFAWGTPPLPANFPLRNRVIAGMSLATVVIEAGEKSGALITANHALQENRLVGAVPGPVYSPLSAGTHKLLRDGALLVRDASDILRELEHLLPRTFVPPAGGAGRNGASSADAAGPAGAGDARGRLLQAIGFTPVHCDELAAKLGFGSREVATLLFELELDGLVRKLPGGYYVRT